MILNKYFLKEEKHFTFHKTTINIPTNSAMYSLRRTADMMGSALNATHHSAFHSICRHRHHVR